MPPARYGYYRNQRSFETTGTMRAFVRPVYNKPKVYLAIRELLGDEIFLEEFDEFKIALHNATLKIPDEQNIRPCFIDTFLRQGLITVICNDKFSEKWLKENATEWRVGESQVRLVSPGAELVKMTVVVPPPTRELGIIFRLLSRQNDGLRTDKWVILRKKELFNGMLLVLGMDENSADYLKHHGYKAYMGCGRLSFRPAK